MYKDVVKNSKLFEIKYPDTIVPTPSESDYKLGFIRRYFTQKAVDVSGHVYEISESTYSDYVTNPFWISTDMKWRISGPIEPTYKDNGEIDDRGIRYSNKAAINGAASKLKNIGLYLPNLVQFYK
jgi:hypothetical protein